MKLYSQESRQAEEIKQRAKCDYILYVITPKMTGVYSIAELVDDSNKRTTKTIFCYVARDGKDEFSKPQIKSLNAVGTMIVENGAIWCRTLKDVIILLNKSV